MNSLSIKYFHTARNNAFNVSIAKCPACAEASGRPPTSFSSSSLLIARAKSRLLPFTNSVTTDPHAIADTHPLARNRMSAILSPSRRKVSSRMSPHAGFSSRAVASGFSDSRIARILEMVEQFAGIHAVDCNGVTSRQRRSQVPAATFAFTAFSFAGLEWTDAQSAHATADRLSAA